MGFTLVELAVVLAIGAMVAIAGIWFEAQKLRVNKGGAQGTQLATLTNGLGTYAVNHYTQLVNGQAIAGFANVYAPTVAELRTAGLLPANFNATSIYGSPYLISVARYPAGCISPACDITVLACVNGAITNPTTGLVDGAALGTAALTAGVDAGYSVPAAAGTIVGVGGAWSVPNPSGSAGGILCMRSGYGSSGWAQFLRRDGTLPMTGNLNMGSQNINSANTIHSTTLANTGNAAIGGALGVSGLTTTTGIANTGNITNSGSLATGNTTITGTVAVSGNATLSGNTQIGGTLGVSGLTTTAGIINTGTIANTGHITTTGDVTTGRLKLNTIVVNNSPCPGLNGYQAATAAGSIASCINGTWTTPNTATGVPPPCASQSITWGATAGCSGTLPATASGNTATVSASSPHSGSAIFACTAGTFSYQSGTCNMQCPAQTVTWGSGCQAAFPATAGGGSVTRSATNAPYSGTGTATCSSATGTWSASGSCSAPAPCSGSVSWGNGNCSATYSLASGGAAWLSYSGSNTYGGYNLGGSISGSAYASCNNGALTISNKSCNYSGSYPMSYNSTGGSGGAPKTVYIVSDAAGPYCSNLLGSGTSHSISKTQCPNDDYWFTWVGRITDMSWDAMVNGNGCNASGCSCYTWRMTQPPGTRPDLVSALTCTNNN